MEDKEINLVDHLDELRKRIIICAVAFILFLTLGLIYVKNIYLFFMGNLGYKLLVLGPSEIIWIYFHLASVVAIAGTIPVAAWQIWLFVKPALKSGERKAALAYIPALFLLFIAGLSFGYFFVFPNIMRFLTKLGSGLMNASFTADKYFSFLLNITLPFGVAFEMPIVFMFLTAIGIINPYKVVKLRKYAYFVLVIIACVISPPEFISHISVSIPLILIFEVSVFVSKLVFKKKLKRENALSTDEGTSFEQAN